MEATDDAIAWPALARPLVDSAGCFAQADRGFASDYRNQHLSVHLFGYAGRIRIGRRIVDVQPDDLTLTPPGWSHAFDLPRPGVHWTMRLAPDPGRCPGEVLRLPLHQRLGRLAAIEARARMRHVVDDLAAWERGAGPAAQRAAGAGAQALLCWLAARAPGQAAVAGRGERAVLKAAALLANPDHARLPIDAVARRCGLSRNRLAAAFRRRHGETMARYRARHLVAFAQQWMASTDLTLEAIAAKIGVRDPHHFNKLFRRCAGESPSAWRAGRQPVLSSVARPGIPGDVPAWSGGRPNVERIVGG